ncbi:hypothetical protein COH20_004735 [Aspergillus flavus]|uniref:Uncharacterized protein n=1 Tax=Aspergillus flavus TaxID=5059 RepID=A0AB74C1V4_ASPFL|nr:hypothetical protein COH20_004735 [Aspergillus flavus]RAQ75641.1 hypothetical protein COH21_007757 [Aspergillus flavus]RMZ40655.1 hypothetical protein CA14_001669 [Aspergillus flavus]
MASAYQPSAWPNIQKRKRLFFDERQVGLGCWCNSLRSLSSRGGILSMAHFASMCTMRFREILAKRETASPLFEPIFLAPQLVNHLESLENFVVDADILISSSSSQGCCEVPAVRKEDQTLDA